MLCIWSIDGNSVVHSWQPSPVNGPLAKLNNFIFSKSCRPVTFVKFGFLRENTARYLKQYLLCVPLFLPIMLNWSIRGNLTLYIHTHTYIHHIHTYIHTHIHTDTCTHIYGIQGRKHIGVLEQKQLLSTKLLNKSGNLTNFIFTFTIVTIVI
jgi:hypothetical protein